MSKQSKRNALTESPRGRPRPDRQRRSRSLWLAGLAFALLCAALVVISRSAPRQPSTAGLANSPNRQLSNAPHLAAPVSNALPVMEINHAVMVTVELAFGPKLPTIAEALNQVERRYQPDDGHGRTFAILDAYGQPTPAGKLHISMHVSTEKPGAGALIFRPTQEVLWQSRIVPGTNTATFSGKNLLILLGDAEGHTVTVDGSRNPASILDATIKDQNLPVSVFWPDGEEREATFIYSACGCPVKVMAKRRGDRTIRTKDLPVIFPDDPSVVTIIKRLMGW